MICDLINKRDTGTYSTVRRPMPVRVRPSATERNGGPGGRDGDGTEREVPGAAVRLRERPVARGERGDGSERRDISCFLFCDARQIYDKKKIVFTS